MWNIFYRNPRLLALTIALIIVSGLAAYNLLPRKEDPTLTNRNVLILTRFPGANAERVEALVTDKIETELREMEEINELVSTSRTNISQITVELHDTIVDTDEVWSRVRDRLGDVAQLLPEGAQEPELDDVVTEIDAYTLITALTWEQDTPVPYAILRRLAESLEDGFRAVPGTKHTLVTGDPEEEIRVEVDAAQLTALGLTSADVSNAIRRTDSKVAAGQLRGDRNDLLMEVEGQLDALEQVRRTTVQTGPDGQVVLVGDLAKVRKTVAEPPSDLALIDGRPGVVVAARMEGSRRIDQWAIQARAAVETFRQRLPDGIGLQIIFDQSRYVNDRLNTLERNLIYGAILVLIVIFVMMGWRAALLVGSALPLSSLMVLTGMRLLGVPIHQMSVTGLIVALGMLIDNAIIVVDEVQARLRNGESPSQAVASSVRHLLVPLFGSTLTTVLAFMPLVLMPGGAGEFVGPIGISVILALLSSFLVALAVVSSLTGLMHRANRGETARTSWLQTGVSSSRLTDWYRRTLRGVYALPLAIIIGILALSIGGFVASSQLEEQFFPPSDRDQFQIQLTMPAFTSLRETQRYVQDANDMLRQNPDVKQVHWFIGDNAPKFYYNMMGGNSDAANFAQALVQLHSAERSFEIIRELQKELDQQFPAAQVLVRQLEQGPPFDAPIELRLFGPDVDRLWQLGEQVREILAQVPDVIHTEASLKTGRPKLWLQLDAEEARLAGLDNVGIAAQLQQTLEGAVGGSLIEGTEELPVRVQLAQDARRELAEIASLDLLPAATAGRTGLAGSGVPVEAVGQLTLRPELASITRRNGERSNTIAGFITAGVLPATVLSKFEARLEAGGFALPPGYRYEFGGESGERDEAVGNLLASVGVLLVLMLATLVLSFNSFRMAALIGVVAGLSASFAMWSLWLFDYPFGFTAIVGTMGLIGVAVNDSIVVLAALREDPEARSGEREAVITVVIRSTRHVLSTTVTTMAGFTPLVISGGGFWPPVAISIAGGVTGATLLALYFVPSAYILLMCRRSVPQEKTAPDVLAAATGPSPMTMEPGSV
ncbi:MAG: hypothetical protein ETSY1_18405 [Candidatus Entotheonella factor]|uniref:Acriflavin resistance protein n=1 Tax=Entotheonella factor TaxID=1429438 RepID=W4LK92_ENTF1|nr:MAG: hypothetical protein ETSY1_18405 [Candidatus Entotheonella factor]